MPPFKRTAASALVLALADQPAGAQAPWDAASGQSKATLLEAKGQIPGVAFSPERAVRLDHVRDRVEPGRLAAPRRAPGRHRRPAGFDPARESPWAMTCPVIPRDFGRTGPEESAGIASPRPVDSAAAAAPPDGQASRGRIAGSLST